MKSIFGLWSWQGVVSRAVFVLAGVALFAVKFPLDYLISRSFGQPWGLLSYLSPRVSPLLRFGDQPEYWMTLMLAALPFIAAGMALCARRLRDMGVSPFFAGLFLLPFLHFAFFLVLAFAPSKELLPPTVPDEGPYRTAPPPPVIGPPQLLLKAVPQGAVMAFLLGLLASVGVGAFGYLLSIWTQVLGVGLFIGVPFAMGFIGGFIRSARSDARLGQTLIAGLLPNIVFILILLAVAREGVACIIMATPILVPLNLLGAWAAWVSTRRSQARASAATLNVIALPLLLLFEIQAPPAPVVRDVASAVTIFATPAEVWSQLSAAGTLDAPAEPIFAIAPMPVGRSQAKNSEGDRRVLDFTIGRFVHTLTEVEPERRMVYVVEEQPHNLDDLVKVLRSEVVLAPNPDGSTVLRARTSYSLSVHPAAYWGSWADRFAAAAQNRVLQHIKNQTEHPPSSATSQPAAQPFWMQSANATCHCTRHE